MFVLGWSLTLGGCFYSFTGASVPEHWKSISIPIFEDESAFGQPALREQFTTMLIAKVQQDNTLSLAGKGTASVELSAKISAIAADRPVAVSQGTQASRLQVSVSVSATLYDNVKKKQVWQKSFQSTGEYAAAGGAVAREDGIRQAMEKITDDLLLETVSAW